MKKAIKVAFVNTKGGTTKTTSVVNIAAAAAGAGVRTLLIDFDIQGEATRLSGIDSRVDIDTEEHSSWLFLDDRARGARSLADLPIETKFGFDLIPSSGLLANADNALANSQFGDGELLEVLNDCPELTAEYDLILCDTQGAPTRLVKAVLIMCGEFIIPSVPKKGAVSQLEKVVALVAGIKKIDVDLRAHFWGCARTNTNIFKEHEIGAKQMFGDFHFSDYTIPDLTVMEEAAELDSPLLGIDVTGMVYRNKQNLQKLSQMYEDLFFAIFPEFGDKK